MIAVSQRVMVDPVTKERRDALDQNWIDLLSECKLLPLLVPNKNKTTDQLLRKVKINGILLTGGNSLYGYGGDAPERDEVENILIAYAMENKVPLMGVCRGMQMIQHYFGIKLIRVRGHVTKRQIIQVYDKTEVVNSYHDWGTFANEAPLEVWARSGDGVVKAVNHNTMAIKGIMWHPERFLPFREQDRELIQTFFQG
jgi:putative glutamine amidotransferase